MPLWDVNGIPVAGKLPHANSLHICVICLIWLFDAKQC